ncbi:MAG: AMP-binding protein [Chthoniobacterales bacterium]
MNTKPLHDAWSQLPRQKIRTLQAAKLRAYLRDVVLPYHPHYREEFLRLGLRWDFVHTLEDLQKLPFTSKQDLMGAPDRAREYIIAPTPEELSSRPATMLRGLLRGREHVKRELEEEFRPLLMTSTTGRSAEPVPFVYTHHDIANLESTGSRVMEMAGAQKTDRMLNMFPFAPHLAFWQTHYAATAFGVFMLSSGGGKAMGTDGNIRMLSKLKPNVLVGMPTFIYHVLHEASLDAVRCENLRCLVLGGEKVPQGMRVKLQALAAELGAKDVNVISTYGFTEAKMAFCQCLYPADAPASGYHLYPDLGIVEIVHPETGRIMGDGEPGEIVFTSLDSRGSCVLRYRTGDIIDGGLSYEPCRYCGRRMPQLIGSISRKSEIREMQLDKIKGTLVDFNELEHVLDDLPNIGTWQIELRKAHDDPHDVDELILHVAAADGMDETKISEEIMRHVFERTELHPNRIQFHSTAEIRKLQGVGLMLKEQKVVDRRSIKTGGAVASQGNKKHE